MTTIQKTPFTIEWLLSLPEQQRTAVLRGLTRREAEELKYCWEFWARPKQLAPEVPWNTWLRMAGRGEGKSRSGSEWIRKRVTRQGAGRIALVAQTPADARDVMIEGESGILTISPPWNKPLYEPSKRRLTWPNGATAITFSGANPDQLRGPQFDTAWCDELPSWQYPRETWDNLMFGLRLGADPKTIVTATPKPISVLREIRDDETTVVSHGSSYDNRLNLSPAFFNRITKLYKGTRTGQQEIYGELLDEAEGALWKRANIEKYRIQSPTLPDLTRIVVAIDPAASNTDKSDETGIIGAGIVTRDQGYVLGDASGRYSPRGWGLAAIRLYHQLTADRIVGEVNNGGEMVENTLRTIEVWQHEDGYIDWDADVDGIRETGWKLVKIGATIPYTAVHASRGKAARAEPVSALYEQGRVHHVGMFEQLEDQLVSWEPLGDQRSPDRLDALVWALTELMVTGGVPNVRFIG